MMEAVLHVLGVILAAIVMGLPLAHALELPGKLRLPRDAYLAVQTIYYPGFTLGGIAEPLTTIVVLVLLLTAPGDTTAFWLLVAALVAFVGVQAVFWIVVQPVNKAWLKEYGLGKAGESFFNIGAQKETAADTQDWTIRRGRWEGGHVARAVLAMLGLIALTLAAVLRPMP